MYSSKSDRFKDFVFKYLNFVYIRDINEKLEDSVSDQNITVIKLETKTYFVEILPRNDLYIQEIRFFRQIFLRK